MSCYVPVIEKLKLLKTNACSTTNSTSDIKSNLSKSKSSNSNISTRHLRYPPVQGIQQGTQDVSQSRVQPWDSSHMQNPCIANNGDSSNAKINQNNCYVNGDFDVTQGNKTPTNHISSPIHLQQHHFSVPSSLTVPSPPPSYHSNNTVGQNKTSSNKKNMACSPPPPYQPSKTNNNTNLVQNTNQNLHVVPLPTTSFVNNSLLTYQNDITVQHQNLPPRPPKHDNKRSQSRQRDQNGLTIVQQIGTFPNNVPLNIRHNHPTLGLSDVAYQRQHSDHGRFRNTSPIVSKNRIQFDAHTNQQEHNQGVSQSFAQKGVLTLGLPSHWKKLPFKKVGNEEESRKAAGQYTFSVLDPGIKEKHKPDFQDGANIFSTKQSYQTASSDVIHHTYETLNKPSVYPPSMQAISESDRSRTYKNASKQNARNSSLPRRLRKSKTPTPGTTRAQRYRPRSAQDHIIAGSEFEEQSNYQNTQNSRNGHHKNMESNSDNMKEYNTYEVTSLEQSEMDNIFKSSSDQDDDEGIGEGDISTGSKSGERNTTSSSGASSGGSRSPDDEDDSSRQLVRCVESNINHVKSANRRYLPTLPSPSQGPPPRHLLPTKLKPSPAFKMHPIPLLQETPTHNHSLRKPGHPHLQQSNSKIVNSNSGDKNNPIKYLDHQQTGNNTQTLRIKGKTKTIINTGL